MKTTLSLLSGVVIVAAVVIGLAPDRVTVVAQSEGVPNFDWDPLFFQDLPNRWTTGQVGGISVDNQDHIWIAHRPASVSPGERSAAFNPPAARCCTPAPPNPRIRSERQVRQGVWRARRRVRVADDRARRVRGPQGQHLGGRQRQGRQPDSEVHEHRQVSAADRQAEPEQGQQRHGQRVRRGRMVVYPKTNELFVADGYTNRRVIVYDADTGAYKRHWGAYGKPPDDTTSFRSGHSSSSDRLRPSFGNPVHSVVVSNDDMVYVGDRSNNRIQVFRIDGTFVTEVFVNRDTLQNEGTVHNFALSRDPQQRYLFVADGSNKVVLVARPQDAHAAVVIWRAGRAQRAAVLPPAQPLVAARFERQPLYRRSQRGPALLPAPVYGTRQTSESGLRDGFQDAVAKVAAQAEACALRTAYLSSCRAHALACVLHVTVARAPG